MTHQTFKVWTLIQDNGDGSNSTLFFGSKAEAEQVHWKLVDLLKETNTPYIEVPGDETAAIRIADDIIDVLKVR